MVFNKIGARVIVMLFLIAVLLAVVLLAESTISEGKTITVDDSGGEDYTKIQDAIDTTGDGNHLGGES